MPRYTIPASGACEECGYSFATTPDDAVSLVTRAHERYAALLGDRDGGRAPAPDVWSPVAYVCHVADALRAWGERAWAAREGEPRVVPYDQDELARVRGYGSLPQPAALWSLERATGDFAAAFEGADLDTRVSHPEFGDLPLADFARWVAHEVHHHELDVRRGLGLA